MRILQVTPYFAPAWGYGGPPRVMYDYAQGLARRGHEVTVFTTDVLDEEQRAGPAREGLDGVSVRRFRNLSNRLAWRTKKYLPPGLPAALAREAPKFDAIHVTDTRTLLTASAFVAARGRSVPLCLSAHGSLPGSPGLRGAVKRVYDRALVRPMLSGADLLLAQTEHEAELYLAAGGRSDSVRLLPLPIDTAPGERARNLGLLRRRGGFREGTPVALFLGRIHRLKGLDLLLEALEPSLADGALALAVVGRDDGQWNTLASRFGRLVDRGAVRFLGPLYGEDRFSAYAEADVFCLTPPHWEETSLAALEAASCGTPVVVSEQADLPGLTEAGGGFVVPLEKTRIREAVAHVLENSEEMGQNARRLVQRQHDRDAVVERLETYLSEAVSRRRDSA